MTLRELQKTIPLVRNERGQTMMDYKSHEWRVYKSALAAKGRAAKERKLQKHIREEIAEICTLAAELSTDYVNAITQ